MRLDGPGNPVGTDQARLDRQLRIPQWNQQVLSQAPVGVVGGDDYLTSSFLLAASALGLNRLRLLAPKLDDRFLALARSLNPDWQFSHFEGHYSHPLCRDVFSGCSLVVDLSCGGLTNKLLLEEAFQSRLTVICGRTWQSAQDLGLALFTYRRGREWQEIRDVLSPLHLPGASVPGDGVLDIIAAGLILEEVKKILMGGAPWAGLIRYRRPTLVTPAKPPAIGIVGAGALGNFVGLGLALAGFSEMTFIDPDNIEVTNLNRQVFFAGSVGAPKAQTLASRLNQIFGTRARAVPEYFREGSSVDGFQVVFDCVDNFATRILLSEACGAAGAVLISGGTDVARGQVVAYHPQQQPESPARLLGLYDIVARRPPQSLQRERAACIYQPDPAVIMTNQIVGGFMVEALRTVLAGGAWPPWFYDAQAQPPWQAAE